MTRYEIKIDTKHRPDSEKIRDHLIDYARKNDLDITFKEKR